MMEYAIKTNAPYCFIFMSRMITTAIQTDYKTLGSIWHDMASTVLLHHKKIVKTKPNQTNLRANKTLHSYIRSHSGLVVLTANNFSDSNVPD